MDRPSARSGPSTWASSTRSRAASCTSWTTPWNRLDAELRNELSNKGLGDPLIFDGCFDEGPSFRRALRGFLGHLGLDAHPETTEARLDALEELRRGATEPATTAGRALAMATDYQLSEDIHERKRAKDGKDKDDTRKAALAEHLSGLPSQWRGKRYRRQEVAQNPQEREEAENAKQERWSKEVLGLLLEANLPFAASAREARGGLTGPTALRCCRGLRANTLKKRVDDWRPFRRWLLAEGHSCFPTSAQQVLDFLDVQWEASAPRTFYRSFLDALGFLETAGERPEAERLSEDQGVKNAVKALAAKRAQLKTQAEREAPRGEKQAPPLLLAQTAALERAVVDPALPLYLRFYAWAKLLRHWSSLRWDDSMGVSPQKLQMRARGLQGVLERSKTSGPDKAVKLLPIFVSREAWVAARNWLSTGHRLLETELGYPRDYLVPLPNEDLSGTCGLMARYSDALGLTRQLLSSLRQPGDAGHRLLLPQATHFWSEHSDRAGCSGWLASLGVPSDQRGFLGRWAVASTADHYVRVAVRVVENLQNLAAKAARHSYRGGPDYFGEEAILEDRRAFLAGTGLEQDETDAQLLTLTRANAALPIPTDPRKTLSDDSLHDLQAEDAGHEAENDAADESDGPKPADSAPPAEALDEVDLEEVSLKQEVAAQEKAATDLPPSGFCIAITNRRVRRLHFIGNCGKVPGEHYKVFEVWGDLLPPEHEVDVTCDVCFKGSKGAILNRSLGPTDDLDELPVATSSSSSTSSSEASTAEGSWGRIRGRGSFQRPGRRQRPHSVVCFTRAARAAKVP